MFMGIEKKRDFLINIAYWAIIAGVVYLAFEYLVPICVPFLLGIPIAWLVVWLSRKLRCTHRMFRLALTVVVYGILGLLIAVAVTKGISGITGLVKWQPKYWSHYPAHHDSWQYPEGAGSIYLYPDRELLQTKSPDRPSGC